jgi:multidrug efflux system outer membrane protein
LQATTARHAQGFASLIELEEARRVALAAQSALLSLDLETKRHWIALYRAVGGGFQPQTPSN